MRRSGVRAIRTPPLSPVKTRRSTSSTDAATNAHAARRERSQEGTTTSGRQPQQSLLTPWLTSSPSSATQRVSQSAQRPFQTRSHIDAALLEQNDLSIVVRLSSSSPGSKLTCSSLDDDDIVFVSSAPRQGRYSSTVSFRTNNRSRPNLKSFSRPCAAQSLTVATTSMQSSRSHSTSGHLISSGSSDLLDLEEMHAEMMELVQQAPDRARVSVAEGNSSVEILETTQTTLQDRANATNTTKASSSRPSQRHNGSGWFTKPESLIRKENVPLVTPTAPGTVGLKTTTRKTARQKAAGKADRNRKMREAYPVDFHWRTWSTSQVPKLIYTAEEHVVDREVVKLQGPLGFDCEWEPSQRRGVENKVAVLQLCSSDTIILVHLSKMKRFPPAIERLLHDDSIIKLGVQIAGDARKLIRDFGVHSRGLLDLSNVARLVDGERYVARRGLIGLQELVGTYLDKYLDKGDVRTSQWTRALDSEQQSYAGNDVYSSLQVYKALQMLAKPEHDISKLASNDPSTASTWRDPAVSRTAVSGEGVIPQSWYTSNSMKEIEGKPRQRMSPRSRELEAYDLWHKNQLSATTVAVQMGLKPLSVVWNLLGAFSTVEGQLLEYDTARMHHEIVLVEAESHARLMAEHGELVKEIKAKSV
ncbi:hypothetical protein OIO90_002229 [Microbotryomycetes sp. JL221]|nr:hypothetical protein OIO90_002229 [Microbotryomycetes sp. JL221]